jgi:uncharacterized protein
MDNIKFIDIHSHAYLFPGPPHDGHTTFCTPEEVLIRYDEIGIEYGVLLPLIGPETYLPQSNEEILETCKRYPDRFIPFCNIDPRGMLNTVESDFSIWIDWYIDHGFKGVGELMPNLPFTDPKVLNLMSYIDQAGLPLTFDGNGVLGSGYGLYDEPGLPQLEYCLKRFPNIKFLGHGPGFWAEIAKLRDDADMQRYPSYPVDPEGAVPRLLREYDNMLGDLSAGSGFNALDRDHDYAIKFLNEFQDKLYFGTDICCFEQVMPLADFLRKLNQKGHLSDDAFYKIARGNAEQLLNL